MLSSLAAVIYHTRLRFTQRSSPVVSFNNSWTLFNAFLVLTRNSPCHVSCCPPFFQTSLTFDRAHPFMAMSAEPIEVVLSNLPLKDLLSLSQANRFLRNDVVKEDRDSHEPEMSRSTSSVPGMVFNATLDRSTYGSCASMAAV